MNEVEKATYLKENGWWAHYHPNCWFKSSKDELWVNDEGDIVGFRPESEGITLEEAFNIENKVMKVFKDLVFKNKLGGGIGARMDFDNGFSISVIAGKMAYSTPREDKDSPDDFASFEVAVFGPDGDFNRKFFPEGHLDDVLGWQDRGQINALMLLIQSK